MNALEVNHALEQACAQASSIVDMVAALECDYDRLEELRDEREGGTTPIQWAAENPEEAEELNELENAAGDCISQDDARERIEEGPLSIEVRSSWQTIGEALTPSEFCVLLCTGGPAVRIVGELDENLQPCRAWVEYQDWGTPWMQLVNGPASQGTLLTYCQQFYFGEC